MKIILKFFPVLLIIFSVFFINTQNAQAACNYTINDFNSSSKTTATPGEKINYVGKVSRAGDLSSCQADSGLIYRLEIRGKGYWSAFENKTSGSVSYSSGSATLNYSLDLATFNRSLLETENKVEARLVIVKPGFSTGLQNLATSASVVVQITGAVGGSGTLIPKINFNPNNSSFKKDDKIQINISADNIAVNSLPTNIANIYIQTDINGIKIGGFNVKRQDIQSSAQYQNATISQSNSFKDGVNTVKVSFWESGSSVKLGESTATLSVTGIGTTAVDPGSGGTGAGGSNPTATTTNSGSGNPGGMQNNSNNKLFNPLPESDLQSAFLLVLQGLLGMLGMLATVFVVVGGVQMVLAAGNEEGITKAKKTITWAVIGLIAAMLSFSIIAIVQELLKADLAPASAKTQTK